MNTGKNYCQGGGFLVSSKRYYSDDPHEYFFEDNQNGFIGCNNLKCSSCGATVKQDWYDFKSSYLPFGSKLKKVIKELYEADDWSKFSYLRKVDYGSRIYVCRCHLVRYNGRGPLLIHDYTNDHEEDMLYGKIPRSWRCAGHPPREEPYKLFDYVFDDNMDYEKFMEEYAHKNMDTNAGGFYHPAWLIHIFGHLKNSRFEPKFTKGLRKLFFMDNDQIAGIGVYFYSVFPYATGFDSYLDYLKSIPYEKWLDKVWVGNRKRFSWYDEYKVLIIQPLRQRCKDLTYLSDNTSKKVIDILLDFADFVTTLHHSDAEYSKRQKFSIFQAWNLLSGLSKGVVKYIMENFIELIKKRPNSVVPLLIGFLYKGYENYIYEACKMLLENNMGVRQIGDWLDYILVEIVPISGIDDRIIKLMRKYNLKTIKNNLDVLEKIYDLVQKLDIKTRKRGSKEPVDNSENEKIINEVKSILTKNRQVDDLLYYYDEKRFGRKGRIERLIYKKEFRKSNKQYLIETLEKLFNSVHSH